MKPKKVRGRLTISKSTGGRRGEMVAIRVEDMNSSSVLFDVDVTPREFARAIFSLAFRPCRVKVYRESVKRAGRHLEVKTERLPCSRGKFGRDFPSNDSIKPLEVDGWKADREKFNPHRATGDLYAVTFRRYVKKPKKATGK